MALAGLAVAFFAAAAYVGGRGMATARAEAHAPALAALALRSPLPPPRFAEVAHDVLAPAPRTAAATVRRTALPVPAPSSEPAAAPADVTPPALALAQAPETRATPATGVAPVADRWQAVSDALAQCAEEGGLTGFICDQRVRLNACDGQWGRVAQCPAPSLPANPR